MKRLMMPIMKCKTRAFKSERSEKFSEIKENYIASLSEEELKKNQIIGRYLSSSQKKAVRDLVLRKALG